MKIIGGLIGLIVILIVIFIVASGGFKVNIFPFAKNTTVAIDNHTFSTTIAKTEKERQTGLSDKSSLAQNNGMLFLFDKPGYYSFWMKNMKFPIDIIFIKDNKIVTIYTNIQPPASESDSLPIYQPEAPADKVLEVNAGEAQKYNFKNGDTVTIKQ